jgi:hypothetical protein
MFDGYLLVFVGYNQHNGMGRFNFHVNLRLYLALKLKLWTSLQFSPCSHTQKKKSLKSGGLILVLYVCVCVSVCLSFCPHVENSKDHGTDFHKILYWRRLLNCGCKLEFWPKTRNIYTKNYIHFCKNLERNPSNVRSSEKCFGHKCETKMEHILSVI